MAKSLNELLEIINASDPDAGEEFLKLLEPQKYDRVEMGSILEATIGNDLITYYDKADAEQYLDKIMDHQEIPGDVKDYVEDNRDFLIETAMNALPTIRYEAMTGLIDGIIEDNTNFDVTEFMPVTSDEEFLGEDEDDDEQRDEDPILEEEDEELAEDLDED